MGLSLLRFQRPDDAPQWAVVDGSGARPLRDSLGLTTAVVLEEVVPALQSGEAAMGPMVPIASLAVLSPITVPCQIFAQSVNYPSHAEETGQKLKERVTNVFFRKSAASVGGPTDPVTRPAHVDLLDYELELGVVIGARTAGPEVVDEEGLERLIGAFVVANDISARDVQVPEGQYYKGKSYRGFTPCGPLLFVPTPAEIAAWRTLHLELRVNGAVRQSALAGQMIFPIAETLEELTTFEDMYPGDLLLTGTPGGVALQPPSAFAQSLSGFLPADTKWGLFKQRALQQGGFLSPGDIVEATIRTKDGAIELGTQRFTIQPGA